MTSRRAEIQRQAATILRDLMGEGTTRQIAERVRIEPPAHIAEVAGALYSGRPSARAVPRSVLLGHARASRRRGGPYETTWWDVPF